MENQSTESPVVQGETKFCQHCGQKPKRCCAVYSMRQNGRDAAAKRRAASCHSQRQHKCKQ